MKQSIGSLRLVGCPLSNEKYWNEREGGGGAGGRGVDFDLRKLSAVQLPVVMVYYGELN